MDPTPAKVLYFIDKGIKVSPDLTLVTGGKGPPTTTGNWLKDLEVGTVFFVQSKQIQDFSLQYFRLEGKDGPFDKLICLRSPNLPKEIYVDPIRFCNQFSLYHTYGIMLLPQENPHEPDNRISTPGAEENKTLE